MAERTPNPGPAFDDRESVFGILANLAAILAVVIVLLYLVRSEPRPAPAPGPAPVAQVAAPPRPAPEPAPPEPAAPKVVRKELDRAAVERAEQALDAASRDRARAEARADTAAKQLAEATAQAALDAARSKSLALRVRDPSARLASAKTRGGFLRAERDRVRGELTALARTPRPKAQSLVDKNPVAKPAGGNEYHFEVRRNRVSFIDLDRLLALVKAEVQLRIRLSDGARHVDSKVGPVGPFSLQYVMGRALPNGIEELMERHGVSYDLRGWEVVPEFEGRGETYDEARRPVSQYAQAINRLNPSRATITMWIYPDGFGLYRRLRDDLHARGFMVAARPLPEGMSIRGSPAGSISAGQ